MRVKNLDVKLFITQVKLKTPLLLAHAYILAMKRKAYYPLTHTQIKIFKESSGAQPFSIDTASLEPNPERILIAFIGSASTNQFHFHIYNMTNHVP